MKLWLVGFALLISGCVTGVKVDNIDQSLEEVRSSIVAVSGEFKWVSSNRRRFESQYFPRRQMQSFNPDRAQERLYAKFTVVGDRRPYQILVEVIVEQRDGITYKQTGKDGDMAKLIADDLTRALAKSREERNAIDSFRAF